MHLLHIKLYYSKKQNQQNMNYTQKHNSINIYDKSMRLMLSHFGNNSKNARLHFGKAHGNKFYSFFCFYIYHLRKGLLAKIRCNKLYEYLKGFLSKKRVSYDLVTPKRGECCCSEELLLKLALLKFNDFIEVFIINIFFINIKREWLSCPCWI